MISNRIPTRTRSPERAPAADAGAEALVSIAASLREILSLMKGEKRKPVTEREAIAWLLQRMQDNVPLPSLSEVSRQTGAERRQLQPDRWPKFRKVYDQLAGMERGVDKDRTADCHHDTHDDEE